MKLHFAQALAAVSIFVAASACGDDSTTGDSSLGDVGTADTGTGSGLARGTLVRDLSAAEVSQLCVYGTMAAGGAGTVYPCPMGDVTVQSVADCEASVGSADCVATVGDAEDCLEILGTDACSSLTDPACQALRSCATP